MFQLTVLWRFNTRVIAVCTGTITIALASARSTNDSVRLYVLVYLA